MNRLSLRKIKEKRRKSKRKLQTKRKTNKPPKKSKLKTKSVSPKKTNDQILVNSILIVWIKLKTNLLDIIYQLWTILI